MLDKNIVVAACEDHTKAEAAIRELQLAGFDMKKLSIVGKAFRSEEDVIGYYNAGDRMRFWGKEGAFWGGIWGLVFGSAFFWVPGIGPSSDRRPTCGLDRRALEGAAVVGGLSALGAGLYSLGIPKDSILRYESAVKAGAFLVVAHGTIEEANRARTVLDRALGVKVTGHTHSSEIAPAVQHLTPSQLPTNVAIDTAPMQAREAIRMLDSMRVRRGDRWMRRSKEHYMELGMIGLGRMGTNMVRRLRRAGHQCVVYDLHPEAVQALVKEGAVGATSLEDFVQQAEKAPRRLDDGAGGGGRSDAEALVPFSSATTW